jgi:hypothetical protein
MKSHLPKNLSTATAIQNAEKSVGTQTVLMHTKNIFMSARVWLLGENGPKSLKNLKEAGAEFTLNAVINLGVCESLRLFIFFK